MPLKSKPSLRDVADRAGVAVSTASRALAGHPHVRSSLRERVVAAAQELGYERNGLAESLRRGSSRTVGFIVRDVSSPLIGEIVLGAERVLRQAGYALAVVNSEGQPRLDAQAVRYFRQRTTDGLLLSLADETDSETLAELASLTVPYIAVDRALGENAPPAVYCDHFGGIGAAVRYLTGLGHRRIGLVAGPLELRPGREVGLALRQFAEQRPDVHCAIEHGPFTGEFGEAAASRLLMSLNRPTALIAGGYDLLLGMLVSVRAYGLAVPGDLSIVTFDDSPVLQFFDPAITAISREPLEVGRRAGKMLLERLAGRQPVDEIVPTVFRPRASCAPPAVANVS
jgi:LacI family transcriptional regulator, galactose operon repressor